jgi:2,4-dienoyl-CoA reductase-like NADH-dependent reductase (Old Yellow Enzyme family)
MTETARRVHVHDREPHLFRPLTLRGVTLRNRIMMSPMCQYSAQDGMPNDWHLAHVIQRAAGGVGILCVEATAVAPEGRITPGCLGLWSDAQEAALARMAGHIAALGAAPAIQLGHAGRKASVSEPWNGTLPVAPGAGGWPVVGPSALPATPDSAIPQPMDEGGIAALIAAFAASTLRARRAGFRILEVHAAHGYLINSFLSPLSNTRTDRWGGDWAGRVRLLHAVLDAVRGEWPADLPLFVRISATDWAEGGWTVEDSIRLAAELKARGDVDLIDCSSGGISHRQAIRPYPGYQIPLAEAVKHGAGIATGAVGLISAPEMAEEILASGRADLVILGRVLLNDPNWPLRAATRLRAQNGPAWPVQYERANIY